MRGTDLLLSCSNRLPARGAIFPHVFQCHATPRAAIRGHSNKTMTNGWTGGQYSLYRAIFAIYLLIHFVTLLPWSAELFSNQGALPSDASPYLKLFPNLLAVNDSRAMAGALIATGASASVCFFLGLCDRIAAVVMWYVLA